MKKFNNNILIKDFGEKLIIWVILWMKNHQRGGNKIMKELPDLPYLSKYFNFISYSI
jgi:hypothetical protein